ncbi:MAG: hypothetical protein PWP56_2783 [Acetobacterium sp.]|nr:hypothetical protein [Acetobacterium sp.]
MASFVYPDGYPLIAKEPQKKTAERLRYHFLLIFTNFLNGGERGIRTLGTLTRTHAFQACSFDHSDISPQVEQKTIQIFHAY